VNIASTRLLTDRRDELSHLPVQTVNRLQRLLAELIPGGAQPRPAQTTGLPSRSRSSSAVARVWLDG
jgi:hypothetical protein